MNLLVALYSIACLVWLVPVIRSGRLLTIAMLVLGVGTVLGPLFFAIDTTIQLSLDRILWLALLPLALVSWRLGQLRIPALTRMDFVVAAIVGWFLLSCLRGGAAPDNIYPPARWLFYLVMPAGMYLMARIIAIRPSDVRLLLALLVALGLYLSITGLLEITETHELVFPSYIVDSESWQFLGRARGPLMNPTGNGILISLALSAALLGMIYSQRRGKLLYGIAMLVLLGGLYSTLTRSVWLGGFSAMAMIGLVYAPRWVRVLSLASVVLLASASATGLKDQVVRMKRDKNLTATDAEKSVKLRPLLAVVAYEMFKSRPMMGHGFGRYNRAKGPFHTNRSYGLPLEQARGYVQHNVFLSVLVDTGLVGLGLMVSWLIMIAGAAWTLACNLHARPETRAIGLLTLGLLTAYSCNGMFHDVLIIPMMQMFLFFIGGIAVSVYQYGLTATQRQAAASMIARVPAATTP